MDFINVLFVILWHSNSEDIKSINTQIKTHPGFDGQLLLMFTDKNVTGCLLPTDFPWQN
ncbi:conserved hypothetical protein [Xenorhabdus nematophila F1]|uniref:Uncharacterized protein n=1 Tax=Xenorhabdus nematophila (strain ATCC 19061 / DSM 3370 / CCUG 14189 / LMG 1036 / NCIMB 9965 / AN6) TaxID=406817 RepID=D3VEI3_XENNA|nr:hypothetical protein XNC1_2035 [Xenorhabdus nematophila ATCC 19061]CCW31839.1 conserved hypothetical protein [Xenorhabdus nematophila F1]CEE95049.1 hypothetical protein XNA1_4910004 [Xenorhabdus nematophila str. Anatoliense]CEF30104.1 hypothetical protein XNW1_2240014 [Xenorhabdus nematophila str. Websteri]CEK22962.1 hypothetical protein XNC2_1968 [Xenorhabdus nematophila AN6/1]